MASEIGELLTDAGFDVDAGSILTAPAATAAYLAEHHPGARCQLLNSGDISEDLGDEALDRAFRRLRAGAPLVAVHRNRYWRNGDGLRLDSFADLPALLGLS